MFRCDGSLVLYWVPGDFDLINLELGRGDTIFNAFPPSSLVGQQIHITPPTVEIILTATPRVETPLPTQTPQSYPPATPEPTQTPVPYDS